MLFFSIPKNGVRFGAKKLFDTKIYKEEKTRFWTVMGGLFAGITEAIFVVTPQETLKTKLIHDKFKAKPQYRGLFHGVMKIARREGL